MKKLTSIVLLATFGSQAAYADAMCKYICEKLNPPSVDGGFAIVTLAFPAVGAFAFGMTGLEHQKEDVVNEETYKRRKGLQALDVSVDPSARKYGVTDAQIYFGKESDRFQNMNGDASKAYKLPGEQATAEEKAKFIDDLMKNIDRVENSSFGQNSLDNVAKNFKRDVRGIDKHVEQWKKVRAEILYAKLFLEKNAPAPGSTVNESKLLKDVSKYYKDLNSAIVYENERQMFNAQLAESQKYVEPHYKYDEIPVEKTKNSTATSASETSQKSEKKFFTKREDVVTSKTDQHSTESVKYKMQKVFVPGKKLGTEVDFGTCQECMTTKKEMAALLENKSHYTEEQYATKMGNLKEKLKGQLSKEFRSLYVDPSEYTGSVLVDGKVKTVKGRYEIPEHIKPFVKEGRSLRYKMISRSVDRIVDEIPTSKSAELSEDALQLLKKGSVDKSKFLVPFDTEKFGGTFESYNNAHIAATDVIGKGYNGYDPVNYEISKSDAKALTKTKEYRANRIRSIKTLGVGVSGLALMVGIGIMSYHPHKGISEMPLWFSIDLPGMPDELVSALKSGREACIAALTEDPALCQAVRRAYDARSSSTVNEGNVKTETGGGSKKQNGQQKTQAK